MGTQSKDQQDRFSLAQTASRTANEEICPAFNGLPEPLVAALDAANIAIAYRSAGGDSLIFGAAAQALLGAPPRVTIPRALRAVERECRPMLIAFLRDGARASVTLSIRHAGLRLSLEISLAADPAGGAYLVLRDCTRDVDDREALERERDHLRHTVELNPQLPWLADTQGNVISFTERYEKLTGLTQEELIGDGWELIIHPEDLPHAIEQTTHALIHQHPLDMRVRMKLASGVYRWFRSTCYPLRNEEGEIVRWFGYTEDIDDHVLIEQQIRWTAEHDALTKLPNRMVFNRQLEEAMTLEYQFGQKVAVLLADLDNFKDVNDVLGHDSGDALLVACGDIIARSLPEKALLSRIGGDEFAIILPFDGPIAALHDVCDTIFAALRNPVTVNGHKVECRVSVGAAVFPFHGQSPTELFKNADIALYEAKARGRGQLTVFSLEMKQETQRRVAMVNLGRRAVETDSILPYYQLQVALDGDRPIGFEALLRRRDRQGRICAPSSILAAFDDPEVAEAIGEAMLKAVLADMRAAEDRGIDMGTVSVNFSTAEFRSATFIDRLTNRISDAGIDFSRIMIEVTESVFLGRQVDNAAQTIRKLDELGFKIALDDFGTGYASLVHLRQLPVDTLKIDQSFIRTLAENRDDLAIVDAILNLGASLGLNVIAEGIETQAQLDILRAHNLKYAQGYLFAHPLPIAEALALISPFQDRGDSRVVGLDGLPLQGKRLIGSR